SKPNEARPTTE
ncbi:unnamed protein product, partial [Rotaria sp. Silwood2]